MLANSAFVFLKPHAYTEKAVTATREVLRGKGLEIKREGRIDASEIERRGIADRHFGDIGLNACVLNPGELPVSPADFYRKYQVEWDEVLASNRAFNAAGACSKLGLSPVALSALWMEAKEKDQVTKFGPGFYCGKILPKGHNAVFVFNGFFMVVRHEYVRPGAAIHYFIVNWKIALLSWGDFRSRVVGSDDPLLATADSLRGVLSTKWKDLGMRHPLNELNNGVHASASAFEAFCERINWLGTDVEADSFGQQLLRVGIGTKSIQNWVTNPEVDCECQSGSNRIMPIFEFVGNMDSDRCTLACQAASGLRKSKMYPKNVAFVFIKPHALTEEVKALLQHIFQVNKLQVQREGHIDAETIDKGLLIDRHYIHIAARATLLPPESLQVPRNEFKEKFGVEWSDVLLSGQVFNAKNACDKFGLDSVGLSKYWVAAQKADHILKIESGFYIAEVKLEDGHTIYVINGFFMAIRDQFVKPGSGIYYYLLEWDALHLSWEDFRSDIIGLEDPSEAKPESLRGLLLSRWKRLGLNRAPIVSQNGIHASASPFEALVEQMVWLDFAPDESHFGTLLLNAGISTEQIKKWAADPQVSVAVDSELESLFSVLMNSDVDRCLTVCKSLVDIPVKNKAFLFIKPHALTDATKVLVRKILQRDGIHIVEEGPIYAARISGSKLFDRHFGRISMRATLLKPSQIGMPKALFKKHFGVDWDAVLHGGDVFNAVDACELLQTDGAGLAALWRKASGAGKVLRVSDWFQCGRLARARHRDIFVINGFFPALREQYVKRGSSIHYFVVEWSALDLSWHSFNLAIVGHEDPLEACQDSIRKQIFVNWGKLGLSEEPNVLNNGLHASASPLESLAERVNWLGGEMQQDEFSQQLFCAGIPVERLVEWTKNAYVVTPTVSAHPQRLFDALFESAADRSISVCQRLAGSCSLSVNSAFIFLKPTVVTDASVYAVKDVLNAWGLKIVDEGRVDSKSIQRGQMVECHFWHAAQKAITLTPHRLRAPESLFLEKFKLTWRTALRRGMVVNAIDACRVLEVDAADLSSLWAAAEKSFNVVKLGEDFYCAKLQHGNKILFVINGTFLATREQFTSVGASIHYFEVEWDYFQMSWTEFASRVVGPAAFFDEPANSLRGMLFSRWKELGLQVSPELGGDAGVHASASPFEGLIERMNWMRRPVEHDCFGRQLLDVGMTLEHIQDWARNPTVKLGSRECQPIFDVLKNTDADRCLVLCRQLVEEGLAKHYVAASDYQDPNVSTLLECSFAVVRYTLTQICCQHLALAKSVVRHALANSILKPRHHSKTAKNRVSMDPSVERREGQLLANRMRRSAFQVSTYATEASETSSGAPELADEVPGNVAWHRSFTGHLLKEGNWSLFSVLKGPPKRFVTLVDGYMYWSEEKCALTATGAPESFVGVVDLYENSCELEALPQEEHMFAIAPRDGIWIIGDFEGSDSGRVFFFDAAGSEHSREKWMDIIEGHCKHGGTHRNSRHFMVEGLTQKPDYNGRHAIVVGKESDADGRFQIKVVPPDGGRDIEEWARVKAENLRPIIEEKDLTLRFDDLSMDRIDESDFLLELINNFLKQGITKSEISGLKLRFREGSAVADVRGAIPVINAIEAGFVKRPIVVMGSKAIIVESSGAILKSDQILDLCDIASTAENDAAAKIQARQRGRKARKEFSNRKTKNQIAKDSRFSSTFTNMNRSRSFQWSDEATKKNKNGRSSTDSAEGWRKIGHERLGQRICRVVDNRAAFGTVVAWHPQEPPLFKVLHDDDDEEDLNADELEEAFACFEKVDFLHLFWSDAVHAAERASVRDAFDKSTPSYAIQSESALKDALQRLGFEIRRAEAHHLKFMGSMNFDGFAALATSRMLSARRLPFRLGRSRSGASH